MQEQTNVVARASRWLVILATLPFIFLTLHTFLWPEYRPLSTRALVAYTALVLCFFGAIHWGIALKLNPAEFPANRFLIRVALFWSLVPASLAWFGMMMPVQIARYWLFVALVICLLAEAVLALRLKLPPWYFSLHAILSAIAGLALVLARFYSYY